MKGLIGRKVGMTQVFAENGDIIPVTVLELGPCHVVQVKTEANDGYSSVQLAFGSFEKKDQAKFPKPQAGHFKKAGLKPHNNLREVRIEKDEAVKAGDVITASVLEGAHYVSIRGVSKGKGFAGVMKRHGFKGFPASRGTHEYFRHPGSIGMREWPGWVRPGSKMPGQMGNENVTVLNLELVKIFPDKNLALVKGAVPGPKGGILLVERSDRREKKEKGKVEAKFVNPLKASKKKSGK